MNNENRSNDYKKEDYKKKSNKNILKISGLMIIVGIMLATSGFFMGGKTNLYPNSNVIQASDVKISKGTSKEYLELEKFNNIEIDIKYTDIEFIVSDSYGIDLPYYKDNNYSIDYEINNDTLKIISVSENLNVNILGFNNATENGYIKIYIPKNAEFENIDIKNSSSDLKLGKLKSKNLEINNSFGDVSLYDTKSLSTNIVLKNGDANIKNIHSDKFEFENAFGNTEIDELNAGNFKSTINNGNFDISNTNVDDMTIQTSFGNIEISDTNTKGLNINNQNGDIDLEGEFLGETYINSSFGDVSLKTNVEKSEYNYDLSVSFGNITVDKERNGKNVKQNINKSNNINIECKNGDIDIDFN